MKAFKYFFIFFCFLLSMPIGASTGRLWYRQPAQVWTDALPLGNGRLGAMVYGIPAMEQIQLNEETIWTGQPNTNANPNALKAIPAIQQLIWNGDYSLSLGHPVNSFYHYKLDGIWQKGQEADAAVFGCKPGDIRINVPGMKKESDGKFYKLDDQGNKVYYTADNKYAYSGNDYQVLGHNSPDWTMGFQNSFKYKNFDLTIFMYWRWGQMIN